MNDTATKDVVLITGASSGIGLELARQFASHQHPLILTAPVEGELRVVGEELTATYGVPVRVIARDLAEPGAAAEIFEAVQMDGGHVDILINNAGLGQKGHFWEIPIEVDMEMIRVNVQAVVRMTKLFLPPMLAVGRGRIMNTASVAGFEPGPLLAVYHATKAFVLSLTEALATEVEGKGVSVTALCPGPTDTDFFPKADMLDTNAFQKAHVMSPQEVAEAGYNAVMRGDRVCVPGGMNKALVFSRRLMTESAQAKLNQKFYEEVPRDERKRTRGDIERKDVEKKK